MFFRLVRPAYIVKAPPKPFSEQNFAYWFHPDISDSTLYGRTTFSYASPLIVYHFAFNFMQSPSQLSSQVLPQTAQDQVQMAIKTGNNLYDKLYGGKQKELSIEETLDAFKADINMTEISRTQTTSTAVEVFRKVILHLQPNQVLLIFCRKPYKVISVICTSDTNSVCAFDSQMHQVDAFVDYGAFLLYSLKEPFPLTGLFAQMKEYGVLYDGECDLVLMQNEKR